MVLKISFKPNQDYYQLAFLTDPTFGHDKLVYLLKSDEKDIYYSHIDLFLFIEKGNLLEHLKELDLKTKYVDDKVKEKTDILLCSRLDLNWAFANRCFYILEGDTLTYSRGPLNSKSASREIEKAFPIHLHESSIKDNLIFLDSFATFLEHTNYGESETRRIGGRGALSPFIYDLNKYLPSYNDELVFYLNLYANNLGKESELEKFLLEYMYSNKKYDTYATSFILDYIVDKKKRD